MVIEEIEVAPPQSNEIRIKVRDIQDGSQATVTKVPELNLHKIFPSVVAVFGADCGHWGVPHGPVSPV